MTTNLDKGRIDRAIEALLNERSLFAAAQKSDIPYSSFRRLLSEPAFQVSLREARTQVLDAALTRLRGLAEDAIEVISEVVTGKSDSHLRFSAAKWVIEQGTAGMVADLESRISELEAARGT